MVDQQGTLLGGLRTQAPQPCSLISFQCKPVFRNMRHAEAARPKTSMTDVGKRVSATLDTQQTRRISGRSLSLRATVRSIRFATSSTSYCRSLNRHAPILYSSIFSSKSRLLLCVHCENETFARRGTKFLCSIASGRRHYSHPPLSVASVKDVTSILYIIRTVHVQ